MALARVAARRGSIEDATRYYHNAMYGVWASDPDSSRRKARVELIQFLLNRAALANAESELVALATALPPDPVAHLQAAQLFAQARDYAGALAQYETVLRFDAGNATALAGAGDAAYRSGTYTTALRYLRAAMQADPNDANSRELLATTDLVLRSNPFSMRISDVERNRRISTAFTQAEERLTECAHQTGVPLDTDAPAGTQVPAANNSAASTALNNLQGRWIAAKPDLARLRSPAETDLPDSIMDVVFQIEQQTATLCGQPQGLDLAVLLISQKREDASQ